MSRKDDPMNADPMNAETVKMQAVRIEDVDTDVTRKVDTKALVAASEASDAGDDDDASETTELDSSQFEILDDGPTTELDSRRIAALADNATLRMGAEILRGLDAATDDTSILDVGQVLETLQMDGASMHAVTTMQTAIHGASTETTPIRYLDPGAPRPSIMVLPPGWKPERMESWLSALQGALIQFGTHGFERLAREELDALRERFGAQEDDFWGEGKRSRLMREYLGIHARAADDTTVAEIAAANKSMLGPYMKGFADSLALSNWDLFEVVHVEGAAIVLERLHDGRRVTVNASLDNHDYEASNRVVARLVEFRDIAVVTSNISMSQEQADAILASLQSYFTGRNWRAYMRNEGASHMLRLLFEGLPVRHVTTVADRFEGCSRDDLVELHRLFTELEVGLQEEVDLSREVSMSGASGYAEAFDEGLRFILMSADQTWVIRRLNAERLHVADIRYMESLGLRPRIHGMVTPNRAIGGGTIRHAAQIVRALVN